VDIFLDVRMFPTVEQLPTAESQDQTQEFVLSVHQNHHYAAESWLCKRQAHYQVKQPSFVQHESIDLSLFCLTMQLLKNLRSNEKIGLKATGLLA